MANIFLAWQNRVDAATLSGGSWLSTLPITNMQDRQLQKVARTTNAAATSTTFDVDLGNPYPIGCVALVNHNISVNGRVKISAATATASFANLFTTFTNDYSNAAWTKGNVSVTANVTTVFAPDGTNTASQILGTATTEANIYREVSLGGTSTVTHNIYLRAGSQSQASTKITWRSGGTEQTASCSVDLTTGTVSNITGTASNISAWATSAGDGWYRVTLTGTGTSAANTLVRYEFAVVGSKSIFAWGSHLASAAPMVYESPYTLVWPVGIVPQEQLEWEEDNFWLGTLSPAVRASFQSPFISKQNEADTARYWRVEIFDSANSDGYIQIGRLFMARGWTPSINYIYGAGFQYEDVTPVETSLGGTEYFDVRPKYRTMAFQLDCVTETDAYNFALDLQRVAGINGEVLVMPDGGDEPERQPLVSYLGRLRQIYQIRQSQPTTLSTQFEVKELL